MKAARAPDSEEIPHGERFGKYLLVGEIAQGGMGEVFLAVQQGPEGFSKILVVKRVLGHLTADSEFTRMFIDEARLAARLEHSNIVKTYEFGEHEGQYYTVMEFLAGEDLGKMLYNLGLRAELMALPLAIHITAQLCNGLHFAHELTDHAGRPLHLVHRDVNPANVIVTYTGEVKIIDFGVAKFDKAEIKTATGMLKGKFAYMSPEYIQSHVLDRRSDVFSLGIVLWEMLTGRQLFARDTTGATMYAVMDDPITMPSR
ncbi:MAG TPA: serine/threonine-protein kinase, partial [Kofleriaceae bacterium]|nr:serine/threonine-protein kinase [Kofleriaceae bacterium]